MKKMKTSTRILILGDLHFPFHSKPALKWVLNFARENKPTHIVQIGDLYDQYNFSRFTKENFILPGDEFQQARKLAENMWDELSSSGAECTQILGNHDIRIVKRLEEKLPEAQEFFKTTVLEKYRFPGVTTIEDDRNVFEIGDVSFHHGYLSKLGDHARLSGKSMVVGHSHTGGCVNMNLNGRVLFELNAGYLADETAEPLRYNPMKTSRWTLGCGYIDEDGPRFISYV